MKLYDQSIKEVDGLLQGLSGRVLYQNHKNTGNGKSWNCDKVQENLWKDAGNHNMILRSDMAYELGGGTHAAVSGMMFSSDDTYFHGDEVILYGPELPEIHEDISYARIAMILVDEEEMNQQAASEQNGNDESDKNNQNKKAYDLYKRIEYTRFHVHPLGYMSRISTVNNREPVRIGKQALSQGLTFEQVGNLMIHAYHQIPQVKAVKLIYITDTAFAYEKLEEISKKTDQITESMNAIFHNLIMDCSVCGLKPICDEVDGLKELHFSQLQISGK